MKKHFLIIAIIFITNLSYSQSVRFIVVSNPSIIDSKQISLLDSLVKRTNAIDNLNFIIFTGNLTSHGTEKEFQLLKSTLERLSKPYFLLPGVKDFRNASEWLSYKELFDDKFAFELNSNAFIGLSSAMPFTNLNHFSLENLEWLNSVLDTTKLNKELFIFSSEVIDEKVDNWKSLLQPLTSKNFILLINTSAIKNQQRNLYGYSVVDLTGEFSTEQNMFNYALFEISKGSIKVSDSSNKIWAVINKSIQIENEKVELPEAVSFNSEIIMMAELAATSRTSTTYWNGKIYAFDESGLINCIDTTGKTLWSYDTFGNIFGKPVIADRMLAAASFQGDIVTLSAISGEQIQSIGFEEKIISDLIVINYTGNRELMIPKLSSSKSAIVFGTAAGKVFCYDFETLQEYWVNNSSKEIIRSTPINIENKILFTSRDGYLYCIDSRTGLMIWRWKEKADTDFSDTIIQNDDKNIFVVSSDGILYAIDLLLGKLVWKFEKEKIIPSIGISIDKKHLYAESRNNKFFLISSERGKIEKVIKRTDAFDESLAEPIEREGKIFFSNKGSIFSYDEKFNESKILYLGDAAVHTIIPISGNKFLVSNVDGRILIYRLR